MFFFCHSFLVHLIPECSHLIVVSHFYLTIQDPSAMVIDHIGYALSDIEGDHTLVASDSFIQSDVILGSSKIEVRLMSKYYVFDLIGVNIYARIGALPPFANCFCLAISLNQLLLCRYSKPYLKLARLLLLVKYIKDFV